MTDVVGVIKNVAAIVGPIVGGGGIWAYLAERRRAHNPALVGMSQAKIAEAVAVQTQIILDEHARDRADLRKIVSKQGRRIAKLARDVAECTKHHRICEENLADVRILLQTMGGMPPADTLVINPHSLKDQLDAAD